MSTQRLILAALAQNQEFARKVITYIQPDYFSEDSERHVFESINAYVSEFKGLPNKLAAESIIHGNGELDERQAGEALAVVNDVYDIIAPENVEFLVSTAEKWCKDRALFNAINKSIVIYQGEDKTATSAAIPDLIKSALSITFDSSLGLDFYNDAERRWEYYTNPENRIPFRLNVLNEITNGGIPRKTLNIIAAGINVGKTMCLISLAADYIRSGYNVLYISQEMGEEAITQRVDANLLDTPINALVGLGKDKFMGRIEAIKAKAYGRLKTKEYSPSTASALVFGALIEEYALKHDFVPDVVMVDYIQITASYKQPHGAGSYAYYKSVAEELRALAREKNVLMWTVAQFNRGGLDNTNPGLGDTGESTGIPATADGMWSAARTEELDQIGQLAWKQLKSRYANKATKTHFMTGVDVERQQLFDVAQAPAVPAGTDHNHNHVRKGDGMAKAVDARVAGTNPRDKFKGKLIYD